MSADPLKNSWWDLASLWGAQIVLIPLSLISVSLTTRLLGPEGYGVLALAFSVAQLAFLFGINWTSNGLVRFAKEELVREGSARKAFWGGALLVLFCWVLAVGGLSLGWGPVRRYVGLPPDAVWAVHGMILAIALSNQVYLLLQAHGRLQAYAAIAIVERLVYIVLLGVIALVHGTTQALTVFLLTLLAKGFQAVLGAWRLRWANYGRPALHAATIRKMLAYSWPLIFAFSAGYVVDWVDLYVIRFYLDLQDVGTYQVAYQGILSLSSLLMAASAVTFPIVTGLRFREREDLVRRYLTRLTPQVVFVWGILLVLGSAVSPPLFLLFFGPKFGGAVISFKILLIALAFQGVSVMYSPVLASYDLTKHATGILLIMAIVNLVGDLLLIPRMGTPGAAVATAVAYGVSAVLYLRVGNGRLGVQGLRAVYCLGVPLAGLFLAVWFPTPLSGIAIWLATGLLGWTFARRVGLFRPGDLDVLDKIEMPFVFRRGIRRVFLALSS